MFDWLKRGGGWESPVGDPDQIDIIGARRDGGVDLFLVFARELELSDRTMDVVASKFRNYCQYVKSDDFREEFGQPTEERVRIALRSDWEFPQAIIDLVCKISEEEQPPAEIAIFYEDPA